MSRPLLATEPESAGPRGTFPCIPRDLTRLGSVENGVPATRALLDRCNEIGAELAADYSEQLLLELGHLREQLDHTMPGPGQPPGAGDGCRASAAAMTAADMMVS
jgi:hypothetical protein